MFEYNLGSTTPSDNAGNLDSEMPELQVERVTINSKALDCARTAELLLAQGEIPVPLRRWSDCPAVGLNRWLTELSFARIHQHWQKFPHDGLGVIREVCDIVGQ